MTSRLGEHDVKPVRWIGSSKEELSGFPPLVRRLVGRALWDAQAGSKATYARPLKGFGGAGMLEIVADFDGDTFRAVYTVRFAAAVYVLHVFQKKSKRGIATPRLELQLIGRRLRQATEEHDRWARSGKRGSR
jgi:phage-related protein